VKLEWSLLKIIGHVFCREIGGIEYGGVEEIIMYFLYVGVRKQCMLGSDLSHIKIFFSLDQSNVSLTYL
jgi:hypothetical protein